MKTEREFKISFIKSKANHNNINEVYCDSKTLFNKIMLFISILFFVVMSYYNVKMFYHDFAYKTFNYSFANIISILFIILVSISPTVYYILKIKNFKIYIDNEKLNYRNIFGKTFSYPLTEILKVKYLPSGGDSDSMIISFSDKRILMISSTNRNFELLKLFLISKNLL